MITFDAYERLFVAHGVPELEYLRLHFPRFVATRQLLMTHRDMNAVTRILDVGAHWLHQTLLYAIDGFVVTALDLPATMDAASVRGLANTHGIELLANASLEQPVALAAVPDDTFDIVLFTEVLEHIAFNPVGMWREIYRVARPGACIVVTTPNYYALRATLKRLSRSVRFMGGGIEVSQILDLHTLSHHWKEYSHRELVRYFEMLSPDFVVRNVAYMKEYHKNLQQRRGGSIVCWLENAVPSWRPDLYAEIEVGKKTRGITPQPHW